MILCDGRIHHSIQPEHIEIYRKGLLVGVAILVPRESSQKTAFTITKQTGGLAPPVSSNAVYLLKGCGRGVLSDDGGRMGNMNDG